MVGVVLRQLGQELLLWPLWWYSTGLRHTVTTSADFLFWGEEHLAVRLWFANLGQPMFGQQDVAGRLISFIVRLLQLSIRTLLLLLWGTVIAGGFLFYLILPPLVFSLLLASWARLS